MAFDIRIAPRRHFEAGELSEMYALRAQVFRGRLGWEVAVRSGMEIDAYDALEPLYMMMRAPRGALHGCWRMLPTEGAYMLKDSFSQLLRGTAAPHAAHIRELSRFAIQTERRPCFGFSAMTMEAIGAVVGHGHRHGIERYVTVTTTAIERLLRHAGVVVTRLGEPMALGAGMAVALYVEVGPTRRALFARRLAR
jgi:acyl homoserine lactone synthase